MACNVNNAYCIGCGTGDGEFLDECVDPPNCPPNCLGHFGEPIECRPCPNSRCYGHDATNGTCDNQCDLIHCVGHTFDDEGNTYDVFTHAYWCTDECEADEGADSHQRDFGYGVFLAAEINTNDDIYINFNYDPVAEDLSTFQEVADELANLQATADAIAQAQAVWADQNTRVEQLLAEING